MRGDRAGEQRFAGLNELLRRLAQERDELLSRYELGDVLAEVREELDDIVSSERRALERHIAGVARDAKTTRSCARWPRISPRAARSSSTSCRQTWAARSAGCPTTTSWILTRGRVSTSCSIACAARCSTRSSRACRTR